MGSVAGRGPRRWLLLSVVAATALLASCGGDDEAADPPESGSSTTQSQAGEGVGPQASGSELPSGGMIVRASTEPPAIDPAFVTDTEGHTVARLLFEGLVALAEDLEIVPALATWEVSDDGTLYTFRFARGCRVCRGPPGRRRRRGVRLPPSRRPRHRFAESDRLATDRGLGRGARI